MRLTNRSGLLDQPVEISVPAFEISQAPNTGTVPFAIINLFAKADGFHQISVEGVQVFADTVTVQNLELIPLAEFPASWNNADVFMIPPQNL